MIELRKEYGNVVGEKWTCSYKNRDGETVETWMPCKLRNLEGPAPSYIGFQHPYMDSPKIAIPQLEKRIEDFKKMKIQAVKAGWKKFEGWNDYQYFLVKGSKRAEGTDTDFKAPSERERVVKNPAAAPKKKPRKRGKKRKAGKTRVFVGAKEHNLLKRPKKGNGRRDHNRCVVCKRQVDTYCAVCPSSGPRGKPGKTLCGCCFEGYHNGKLEDTKGNISL
jgi:hypothetical protein